MPFLDKNIKNIQFKFELFDRDRFYIFVAYGANMVKNWVCDFVYTYGYFETLSLREGKRILSHCKFLAF